MDRSFVVGTAGHIDHGKSALVYALTGTDPDRLKEEKERGITIDLGFAHLPLGDGFVASFVDVPGHERFVRNMLAGAHGIDTVLLVVAADEGVMPQTREHFHICRLLGVKRGLVVLTKCDLASPETQEVAEMEARELVAGSFLEGAPVLRTSARSGLGLEELKKTLRNFAAHPVGGERGNLVRLPVDRAFTVHGFGTVVTGTLVSGVIAADTDLEVLPRGVSTRVRGIEVHGAPTERVEAGSRAALNLAGVGVQDIQRGDVLILPGTLKSTRMIDAEVSLLPGARPLVNNTRLRVHLGSGETTARVRLLDSDVLSGNEAGLVQLRLEAPGVAGRGDRFILRAYSPAVTLGGGIVLDPFPGKHRRRDLALRERLEALRGASPLRAAALFVAASGGVGIDGQQIAARVTTTREELLPSLEKEVDVVSLPGNPPAFLSRGALDTLATSVVEVLGRFHKENPLKGFMALEELRGKLFAHTPPGAFERVLEALAPKLKRSPAGLALQSHSVRLSPGEEKARETLVASALRGGLQGVDFGSLLGDRPMLDRVSKVLVTEGTLCRVGDLLLHRTVVEEFKERVRKRWNVGSRLDVGELKEMTGLSRKFVIPLLEYLDRERLTRRVGADRFVLP